MKADALGRLIESEERDGDGRLARRLLVEWPPGGEFPRSLRFFRVANGAPRLERLSEIDVEAAGKLAGIRERAADGALVWRLEVTRSSNGELRSFTGPSSRPFGRVEIRGVSAPSGEGGGRPLAETLEFDGLTGAIRRAELRQGPGLVAWFDERGFPVRTLRAKTLADASTETRHFDAKGDLLFVETRVTTPTNVLRLLRNPEGRELVREESVFDAGRLVVRTTREVRGSRQPAVSNPPDFPSRDPEGERRLRVIYAGGRPSRVTLDAGVEGFGGFAWEPRLEITFTESPSPSGKSGL